MQNDRKKIGLFLIIAGLAVIIVIVYFFFIKPGVEIDREVEEVVNPLNEGSLAPALETNPGNVPVNYQRYDISQEEPRAYTGEDLGKLAMSIAERFGSFSNQSNYGNFTDLKILMTEDMKDWVDSYVDNLRSQQKDPNESYYGITTKALNYEVKKFDDNLGEAEVIISTSRRESTGAINEGDAYLQGLRLIFLKDNGNWLIDAAYWSK